MSDDPTRALAAERPPCEHRNKGASQRSTAVTATRCSMPTCEFCGKPESIEHWRRIARAWERLVNYSLIFGVVVGAGIVGIIWAAVDHR